MNNISNRWPPAIGKTVIIRPKNSNNYYIGKIEKYISNESGAVCSLLNNQNYVEKTLELHYKVPGKGLFLLIPTYEWDYIDYGDYMRKIENNPKIENGYGDFIKNINKNIIHVPNNRPNSNGLHDSIYDNNDHIDDIRGIMDRNILSSKGEPDLDYLFMDVLEFHPKVFLEPV